MATSPGNDGCVDPGVSAEALDAYWMPFTGNRQYKRDPRVITGAEGLHLIDADGRRVFDGVSGLWTCGLGHGRPEIADAVSRQLRELDYAPAFQFGHPQVFRLAERLRDFVPSTLRHAFFTNSGSEAVDTALKMARGYWHKRGRAGKVKLIGRARGYHGVNFGGIAVGGIGPNRAPFGATLDADHLLHTLTSGNVFSRGQPEQGAERADELLELIALHGADSIAAVIVEPVAGSTGVIPPPRGYLQRLREICDRHEILLIFDEVITGLGRMGGATAAEVFGVTPDIMTLAKQLTNGTVPMGAVMVGRDVHDTFMEAGGPDYMLEFPHGYTYSGHPVACAAALVSLDLLVNEGAFERVREMSPLFEEAVHGLRGAPHVVDIRNFGFAAAIQLESYPGEPARRPFEIAMRCWRRGYYVRYGGDTIQLGPPFVSGGEDLERLVDAVSVALREGA